MSMPAVTVLIPVYNRAAALGAVFPSYLRQEAVVSIVLVDDGSSDETPAMMQRLQADSRIPVEILRHQKQEGQPRSRISALAAAQTEWVLFGEDDVYLSPDYVDILLQESARLSADVIAGRLVNAPIRGQFSPDQLVDDATQLHAAADPAFNLDLFSANYAARPPQPMAAPFLHTIALIRRSVFAAVSFDPAYGGNAVREETDFYLAAGAAGCKIVFTPATVCYHLRGAIADTGGQRRSRWQMEYWNLVNTHRLVTKHWSYLQHTYGLRGVPATWMARYAWNRYLFVFWHVLARRTLQPQNRL